MMMMISRVSITACRRILHLSCILLFLLLIVIGQTQGQGTTTNGGTLTPQEFFNGIQDGLFDAIVDVRTVEEFNTGHIENATLVANLASTADKASRLIGCETCTLAIYCRSGARAASAIDRLRNELGFNEATLYNGLGTSQWTDAGFPLVTTPSVDAPCTNDDYTCIAQQDDTDMPSDAPSTFPTLPPTMSPTAEIIPCQSFDNFCSGPEDCCSGRCVLNSCKKKIPERKQSLASNRGGAAGARKASNLTNRRYLKSRSVSTSSSKLSTTISSATSSTMKHRRVKGSIKNLEKIQAPGRNLP